MIAFNLPFLLKDSRGNPSTMLTFVVTGLSVVTYKFLLAGHDIGYGMLAQMSAGEYATAMGVLLAAWWGREHTEKSK